MTSRSVPMIFSTRRRLARDARTAALALRCNAADWLLRDMEHDCVERIQFTRLEPQRAMILGQTTGEFARNLSASGAYVIELISSDEEQPIDGGPFDLIVSLGRLDTVNDLPGALLHLRNALSPGGLMIAQIVGGGSLPNLRQIMLAADGERPAARIHPQVDIRAATALLERAGFARQVVDSATLKASYGKFERLIADLREQGLTNVLADPPPPLTRTALGSALDAFEALKNSEGRVIETFEILTLTGWR